MNRWKQSIGLTIFLIILSGCASDKQRIALENKNAKQALLIQQQQQKIAELQSKLKYKESHRTYSNNNIPKPKKNIKLKKVEDTNFDSAYMYPQTKKTPQKKPIKIAQAQTTGSVSSIMTKTECISMIGQEKFNKYTQMFGSESASIKRCKMLKAMRN